MTQQTFRKKQVLCLSDFFYFIFYLYIPKWILQEILNNRLGTVNDFHWEFKPVLSYSKPHPFSTFMQGCSWHEALPKLFK